jgi:hypothetical protein
MTLLLSVTAMPTALLAADDEEDFSDWLSDWNRFAKTANRYASALNEGRVDDAAKALPRMKVLGAKLFCKEAQTFSPNDNTWAKPGSNGDSSGMACAELDMATGKITPVPCPGKGERF